MPRRSSDRTTECHCGREPSRSRFDIESYLGCYSHVPRDSWRLEHRKGEDLAVEMLKLAVQSFARANANPNGLAQTPISGLMMKYHDTPTDGLHALYSPMICLILQGAKHISIGSQSVVFTAGSTFILSSSIPTTGKIIQATRSAPFVAVAVKIDRGVLAELIAERDSSREDVSGRVSYCLSTETADDFLIDCLSKLVRLIDHPEAAVILGASIMKELHYWLLMGKHGHMLRSLVNANSRVGRLENAIALIRAEYGSRLPTKTLARSAGMSITSFHKYFKELTAMTPGQYQKQIRLMEARRLMVERGVSATQAAFLVGYESTSQFSRDYVRMFDRPPKRDSLAMRVRSHAAGEDRTAAE